MEVLTIELALAGLGVGAIAALSGLGLLATYRLTGVFNLAFGAIAMMTAFVMWQQVRVWHWSPVLAAAVDLLLVCPAFGVVLERVVFRPLQRRSATPAERLVASLGVLVVLLGAASLIWGAQGRVDAPSIIPRRSLGVPGGLHVALSTLVELGVIGLLGACLYVGQRSRLGLRIRAVVERRELAQLRGVDADRVSALGWALGTTLAGLAGILIAPTLRLEPYGFTLVMLETLAVVVIARLLSPVRALAAALLIGVAQAEMARIHTSGDARELLQAATSNLFIVALLGAVLVMRRLEESDDAGATARLATRGERPPIRGWWMVPTLTLGAPLLFSAENQHLALAVPALAVVLVSIVLVSGYSGQISLGQAGFAGLGALVAARLGDGSLPLLPRVPGIAVLLIAPILIAPFGALCGWPAIRRRGLFLALTTFAVSVTVSRFLFEQPSVTTGLEIHPPSTFASDNNFYILELACLGAAFGLVHNLHRGRLGRALLAMRDDEAGALASGVDVRRLKLLVFAASSALAALGGALLAMGDQAFDSSAFDPIRGLIWFAAVVVFGVDSAAGAVIGAGLLVGVDSAFRTGTSTLVVGAGAVLLGRLPGGLLYSARVFVERVAGRPLGQLLGQLNGQLLGQPPGHARDGASAARLTPRGQVLAETLHRRSAASSKQHSDPMIADTP